MSRLEHPLSHEELMAYADGEVGFLTAARAAEHLDKCPECSAIVNDVKQLSVQLASWQVEESPDAVARGVQTEFERYANAPKRSEPQRSWWFTRRRLVYGLGGAAFAALVLLMFVAVLTLLRSREGRKFLANVSPAESEELPAAAGAPVPFEVPRPVAQPQQAGQPAQGQQAQQGRQGQPAQFQPPRVIRTINLTMITKTFDAARTKIDQIVRQSQGYIDRMTVHADTGSTRSLSATLRLAAEQSDSALSDLKTIGRLMQESQNSSDITSQYVDLEARLSNARNSEQRLLTLLRERAGNLKDVVAMEQEISSVRESIDRMEAQRKDFDNKIQFVTIQLELTEEYHAALEVPAPSRQTELRNAAVDGIRSGGENIVDIAVFLLRYGPSLLIWCAVLGALVLVIVRMQGIELRRPRDAPPRH